MNTDSRNLKLMLSGHLFAMLVCFCTSNIGWSQTLPPADNAAKWFRYGNNKSVQGKYEEAIDFYNKATDADPKFVRAWNNKGNALSILKRYTEALECFDKVLEMNPNDSHAWSGKANALSQLNRHDEALEAIEDRKSVV